MASRFPLLALTSASVAVAVAAVVAVAVAAAVTVAAASEVAVPAADHGDQGWIGPPREQPHRERGEATYNLDTLFQALKIAPDEASAKAIEERIWTIWTLSGSDTCNLLMGRAKAAIDEKNYDLGIKLLDAIIEIKPDYVEAWNRRATAYYLKNDFGHSIADISQVLAREPRHFAALSGLGLILQEIGDDKHALEAYRKALAVDPHLEHIPEVVKTLTEKVEGRDI
jgi:tetratricopeptide (TPR) repeat protein